MRLIFFDPLVEIGTLKQSNISKWEDPSFVKTDPKTSILHSIRKFRNLNRQLKCKPHQTTKNKRNDS